MSFRVLQEQILQDRREIGQSAVETAIQSLYHRIMASMLPSEFSGAEWWVQVSLAAALPTYPQHQSCSLHVDRQSPDL